MKNIIFLITLLLIGFTGHSQVNSNCNITEELREAYEDDIYWLAYNRICETNSPYMDSLKIPVEVEDTIWTGLAAIFNADFIPERDSVFDIYCIHHEMCSNRLNTLNVLVDTSYNWTEHWKNNETITGYDELDKFLADYNYKLQVFEGYYGILNSDVQINFNAFSDSLLKFNGITGAFFGGTNCCHNDIYYEKTNSYQYFTFDLGFGHGIILCPNHYIWKFAVDNECRVNLIESRHIASDPGYPDNVKIKNCHITSEIRNTNTIKNFISISPNPTNGFISIKSESNLNYSVTVYDLFGRKVYSNKFTERLEIYLRDYQSGLYFINICNQENTICNNYKIIKE